jgi:hypothetical protein
MGNAHAVAAKRLPAVVQQNPHIRTATATTNTGNAPFPGLVGAGIFGSGIHQAAAAARASLNAANAVVEAVLSLDHEDGLYVSFEFLLVTSGDRSRPPKAVPTELIGFFSRFCTFLFSLVRCFSCRHSFGIGI